MRVKVQLFADIPNFSVWLEWGCTFPVAAAVAKQTAKDSIKDQVAMYMPSCTQAWGAPFLFVSNSAYIRVVTKRIESIGANATVALAASTAAARRLMRSSRWDVGRMLTCNFA